MADSQVVCGILEMTSSMASVYEMDMKEGISLLSLKHHLFLSYLQSLNSLTERTPASSPFSTVDQETRGSGIGDLVDSMIEGRIVVEKIKVLESRMQYQIEKLVRVAEEVPSGKDVAEDPLAFRAHPQNLVNGQRSDEDRHARSDVEDPDKIYRPTKLASMPYTEAAADKRSKRQPIQRLKDFEEENFTRLVLNKKDARRRQKDEEDLALRGTGVGKGRKRGQGLEDEFADVLHSVGRTKKGVLGDRYEELRRRGKKADALSRSRTTWKGDLEGADDDGPRLRKKTRFERAKTTLHKAKKI
ncbi:hypothetical protein EDB19DRAFT_1669332 [Suillus lakei]|nr:hypothetical protein EDB19DRAFT_1669332 [Suillus lakei]